MSDHYYEKRIEADIDAIAAMDNAEFEAMVAAEQQAFEDMVEADRIKFEKDFAEILLELENV